MKFEITKSDEESCGVDILCMDCGELTSVEEWNEFNPQKEY